MHRNRLLSFSFYLFCLAHKNLIDKTEIMSFDPIVNRVCCLRNNLRNVGYFAAHCNFHYSDNNMQIEAYAVFTLAYGIYADVFK